jgi:competence protein ComEC
MQAEPNNFGASTANPASAGLTVVPLFHAAWLFAGGVALAQAVWLRPSMLLIALALIAVLCCVAAFRAQRIVWLPLAVLWCLLGAWCAEMEPHPAPAPAVAALSDGLMRTVEGTITHAGPVRGELEPNIDEAASDAPTQRLDLRVSSMEIVNDTEDWQGPAEGGVRLTVRWPENLPAQSDPQAFECGERIRADVRLLPPQVYRDPGAWGRAWTRASLQQRQ